MESVENLKASLEKVVQKHSQLRQSLQQAYSVLDQITAEVARGDSFLSDFLTSFVQACNKTDLKELRGIVLKSGVHKGIDLRNLSSVEKILRLRESELVANVHLLPTPGQPQKPPTRMVFGVEVPYYSNGNAPHPSHENISTNAPAPAPLLTHSQGIPSTYATPQAPPPPSPGQATQANYSPIPGTGPQQFSNQFYPQAAAPSYYNPSASNYPQQPFATPSAAPAVFHYNSPAPPLPSTSYISAPAPTPSAYTPTHVIPSAYAPTPAPSYATAPAPAPAPTPAYAYSPAPAYVPQSSQPTQSFNQQQYGPNTPQPTPTPFVPSGPVTSTSPFSAPLSKPSDTPSSTPEANNTTPQKKVRNIWGSPINSILAGK